MSQFDFGTIDPNTKGGTQLAVDLNNWRDALHSGHRGVERPLYAQPGMHWVRETSAEQWDLMFYDGGNDVVIRSVNPTSNQLIGIPQDQIAGLPEAVAQIAQKQAADPLLSAIAALTTGAGQFLAFTGSDASAARDIVGTVSQASGVPTGALFQVISNANGIAVRIAGGLQICFRGGLPNATVWTFPAEFAEAPSLGHTALAGNLPRYSTAVAPTASGTTVYAWSSSGSSAGHTTDMIAVGRWHL